MIEGIGEEVPNSNQSVQWNLKDRYCLRLKSFIIEMLGRVRQVYKPGVLGRVLSAPA